MPKKKSTKKNNKLVIKQNNAKIEYKQHQLWINLHLNYFYSKHFLFYKAPGYVTHAYDTVYLQKKQDKKKI